MVEVEVEQEVEQEVEVRADWNPAFLPTAITPGVGEGRGLLLPWRPKRRLVTLREKDC